MADIAQLITEQDLRIEARKREFTEAASNFSRICGESGCVEPKKQALLTLQQRAKAYFSCVESCIIEGCVAGAINHPAWREDTANSAENVLLGVLTFYSHLRKHRNELGLAAGTFEPSGNIFLNMQGMLAQVRPNRATELKQQYINANLPHDGFDKPLQDKPLKSEKNNPWISGTFYLFAYVVVLIGLVVLIRFLPWYAVPPSVIALILLLTVVGALQLKNDEHLKDKSFVELMKLVLKRLLMLKDSMPPN
jgi:hypothetical protein